MNWSYRPLPPLSEQQRERWEQILEERTGIHFAEHKGILQSGLRQRMQEIGCTDFDEYYARVVSEDGQEEWTSLVCSLTVRETSFFRDPDAFRLVRDELTRRFTVERREEKKIVHLWSVGCSSGEEAYSLAMAALQALGYVGTCDIDLRVSGSDISETALQDAALGVYDSRSVQKVTQLEKNRWFRKESGSGRFAVTEDLKSLVNWFQWNVTDPESVPAVKADVIFCQNILIYFRSDIRKKILDSLVQRLTGDGILVVGSGEVTDWQHPEVERIKSEDVQAYRARK